MTIYIYNNISKLSILGVVLILLGTFVFTVPDYRTEKIGMLTTYEYAQLCNNSIIMLMQSIDDEINPCSQALNSTRLGYFLVIIGFIFMVLEGRKIKETNNKI